MKSKLPDGWEEVELGDVVILNYGKSLTKKNRIHGKIPVYSSAGKTGFHNEALVEGPGVIVGRKGTIGTVYYEEDDYFCIDTAYFIKENEKYDLKYLYYLLLSLGLEKLDSDTAVPGLNRNRAYSVKFGFPPLPEQKAIADTLSSLDNKIENNNKTNKNLENQAQAIFKHWFVDFEYPDENGKPYKSSGGEMVESELGMIPKGWEVKKIKEISKDIILGKTPRTLEKDNFGGEVPFLTIPDMHNKVYVDNTERTLSEKGVNTQPKKTVPKNSVSVSCIATPGLVTITKEPTQTNQQINTIIPKIEYTYVYSYMKSISNKIISLGAGGTATNNLNKTQFSNIDIIVPDKTIIEKYHILIEESFELIKINQHQNQKLSQLRDTLLPKLMSGEIRIPLN